MGELLLEGKEVERNEKAAVSMLTKSAKQGYMVAQYKLGICYRDGRGVAKDEREALKWFTRAASQGFGVAKHARDTILKRQKRTDDGNE